MYANQVNAFTTTSSSLAIFPMQTHPVDCLNEALCTAHLRNFSTMAHLDRMTWISASLSMPVTAFFEPPN